MNPAETTVVVIGQGYVGLPVAMRAVEVGYRVVGIDLDAPRIASLRDGISYVDDISSEALRTALDSGRYFPTTDYADTAGFDFAVITVPTPLRESLPDLTFIERASASIGAHLTSGATVILESTTYPGTTEELLVPILEQVSGLHGGVDFHAGYSPERIDPGNKTWGFVETPKVVSGIDARSLEVVQGFYDTLINTTVPVSTPREAELTKLLENTFRHVNIALVNELAVFGHQLDVNVWEAIDAAATKPFGFMKFTPGPGVGGHCLPVDPSYLSWQVRRKLGQSFRFVELANDVNDSMPQYVVQRITIMLNELGLAVRGRRIALVGLAYKQDSGDTREAPATTIAQYLSDLGASVIAIDHHVAERDWPHHIERASTEDQLLENADAVVILTDHSNIDWTAIEKGSRPVLDCRNRLHGQNVQHL